MAGRRASLMLAVVVTLIAFGSHSATAAPSGAPQSPPGITISPSLKDITINPGLIAANTTVTITNNSGARLIGNLRLLDIDTTQGANYAFLGATSGTTPQYGLANWLTLPNGDTLNVADGQSATIPIRIDNRADLAPGGHYGALVVGFGSPSGTAGSGKADFKQQLASLLFVRKRGGERLGINLDELKVLPANVIPKTAILKFTNTGNVHVAPLGYITVTNPSGRVVAKSIINTDASLILPGTSKLLESTVQVIDKRQSNGKYTVTAHYRYDEQAAFATKSVQFSYHKGVNVLVIGAIAAAGLSFIFVLIYFRLRSKK